MSNFEKNISEKPENDSSDWNEVAEMAENNSSDWNEVAEMADYAPVIEKKEESEQQYGLEELLQDLDKGYTWLDPEIVGKNIDTILEHGADIDIVIKNTNPGDITKNLETLIEHGGDIIELVRNMPTIDISKKLDTLLSYAKGEEVDYIASCMGSSAVINNLGTLLDHGANIDVNELASRMRPDLIEEKTIDSLLEHGADINIIVGKMQPEDIDFYIDTLEKYGYKPEQTTNK